MAVAPECPNARLNTADLDANRIAKAKRLCYNYSRKQRIIQAEKRHRVGAAALS